MTVLQLYQTAYQTILQNAQEPGSCAFDLSCLLELVFGFDRFHLPSCGSREASPAQAEQFQALCARYLSGEPLQYLLGEWEFFGLPFAVGEGVLIPRPDTETLVETGLSLLRGTVSPAIADLCAGSGCVGIALASQRPDATVYALERSEQAFGYLQTNIGKNHAQGVRALLGDALSPPVLPPLDCVVSNPPYIPRCEMETLQPQVKHEPRMALFGGEDGYDFYRALPALYLPRLKPGGAIAFEVGYNQAEQVSNLLAAAGYIGVGVEHDLGGIARVVYGRKPLDSPTPVRTKSHA